MQIVYKNIDEIREYEKNPRKNDEAVKYVANSIKEFGFKVPIVIDSDGIIVAGHTRVKAARELGIADIPCIVADDLTPEQVKAFRLADNKTAEMAGWDFTLLQDELADLSDFNMGDYGFTQQEDFDIDSFFEDAEPKEKEPKMITCPHCGKQFEA